MANNLPDYLRMQTEAAPYENQVFTCGNVRFTVITPQIIRIEQGKFTDEATLTVLCRKVAVCPCETFQDGKIFYLRTAALKLKYNPDLPLEQMPIFLKAGGIVPLQKHIPGNKILGRATEMELFIAPGDSGSFSPRRAA